MKSNIADMAMKTSQIARRVLSSGVVPSTSPRPLVIAIHGYMGNRLQLLPASVLLKSRGFDVLNFSYPSRAHPLAHHASSLADAIAHRAVFQHGTTGAPTPVHFVTHSFGGVVLSAALLEPVMKHVTLGRAAIVAPPARGCQFASIMFRGQGELKRLPDSARAAVVAAAGLFLGEGSGKQIATMEESWFGRRLVGLERAFSDGRALVVAGNVGGLNPLVDGPSDGVVRVSETVLGSQHWRVEEPLTHNALIYSPTVLSHVADFLSGSSVGTKSAGVPWGNSPSPVSPAPGVVPGR